jgi:hypothetical protein
MTPLGPRCTRLVPLSEPYLSNTPCQKMTLTSHTQNSTRNQQCCQSVGVPISFFRTGSRIAFDLLISAEVAKRSMVGLADGQLTIERSHGLARG